MTPEQKASELINKMYYTQSSPTNWVQAKECALITVNEMISNMPYGFCSGIRPDYKGMDLDYWEEVKQEIEKL